jgi:hypothetical protein
LWKIAKIYKKYVITTQNQTYILPFLHAFPFACRDGSMPRRYGGAQKPLMFPAAPEMERHINECL